MLIKLIPIQNKKFRIIKHMCAVCKAVIKWNLTTCGQTDADAKSHIFNT